MFRKKIYKLWEVDDRIEILQLNPRTRNTTKTKQRYELGKVVRVVKIKIRD